MITRSDTERRSFDSSDSGDDGDDATTTLTTTTASTTTTTTTSFSITNPITKQSSLILRERLLEKARFVLATAKVSNYSHQTYIDEGQSVYHFDCSGLVNYLLEKVSKTHLDIVRHWGGSIRPRVIEYFTALKRLDESAKEDAENRIELESTMVNIPIDPHHNSNNYNSHNSSYNNHNQQLVQRVHHCLLWTSLPYVHQIQPGDMLVYKKENRKPGENTGHIMIFDEEPVLDSGHNAPHHHQHHLQYRAFIIDSTQPPTHAHDTRKDGRSGIGRGMIWLDVDEAGRVISFRWNSASGTIRKPVTVGRIEDVDKKRERL